MNHNYSDEELLTFIIGDGSENLRASIKVAVKSNPELKSRLELLALIRSEIKSAPLSAPANRPKWNFGFVLQQAVLLAVVFFIGLYTQSNLQILSSGTPTEIKPQTRISQPLTWEDSNLKTLM